MISIQDIQSVNPSVIARPNYEHLRGVKVLDNILLDLNKIYYDEEGNIINMNISS